MKSSEDFKIGEVDGKEYTLLSTRELYNFDSPPYVIVGTSGRGKTTICLDILHSFAGECNNIYFITNTKASLGEDDLRQIPQFCIRDPKDDPIGVIGSAWKDLCTKLEAMNPTAQETQAIIARLFPNTGIVQKIENHISTIDDQEKKNVARIELYRQLIVRRVKQTPDLMRTLTVQQRNIVRAFNSVDQKAIFILDDVSESILEASTATNKRGSGANVLSAKNAFKKMLLEIFTRVRHFKCLCCIFIHDLSLLDQIKTQIGTICILDNSVLTTYSHMISLPEIARDAAVEVEKRLGILSKYNYHYLLVNNQTGDVSISKAALHKSENSIPLSPIVKKLLSVYASIEAGEALTTKRVQPPVKPSPPIQPSPVVQPPVAQPPAVQAQPSAQPQPTAQPTEESKPNDLTIDDLL